MTERSPKGTRLHIGIFGRRNAGKSSLLNAITRQQVSIVSPEAGTTTDPVEKPMEILPLGPVLFIDTAGVDDHGALGELRMARTRQVFDRTDIAAIVAEAGQWGEFEDELLAEFRRRATPAIAVLNKVDVCAPEPLAREGIPVVHTDALHGRGISEFREALLAAVPPELLRDPAILGDLVGPGELAILVVPIDKEAPKGRLILPQVQSIRDLLDSDSLCMVVKERELRAALGRLNAPPKLVVTDSQAFLKVAADTPPEIPMTSFSILFSRLKGDLTVQVEGAMALDRLRSGDRVLVAEACTHHPITDDIGRVKIPRWIRQYTGAAIEFEHCQGHDMPADLAAYGLVVHCGACMWNRREMQTRIHRCREAGVPISNYGLVIAYALGIFERALQPFPAALDRYRELRSACE
jgi:[FeFe] hydrogenase H-cluster maturation GTPase HydF